MNARLLVLAICAILASCSQPDGPEPLPPLKATFEWRLDTIRYPGAWQFRLHDVYGAGDGTVYLTAMGNAGSCGMLWKYTDSTWSVIELNQKYGGPLNGQVSFLADLDGAGENRVWMIGTRYRDSLYYPVKLAYGFLASYDGKQFNEVDLLYEPELTALDVVDDDDIWFGCRGPYIYHYDGSQVRKVTLPIMEIEKLSEHPIDFMVVDEIAFIRDGLVIAVFLSYGGYGGAMVQIRLTNENQWEIADYRTGAEKTWGGGMQGYWVSPEGNLYSGGDHVYRYEQGNWSKLYWSVLETHQVFGSSERDIWAVGVLNNVARGVDGEWKSNVFFRIPDAHKTTAWRKGWTDGDKVFIVGNPDDAMDFGVVAHGK